MKQIFKKSLTFLTILITIVLCSSMLVYSSDSARFLVGDYIYFGSYDSEPILWRVINIDDNGNPMLLSDKIISRKTYSSQGANHTNYESFRQEHGSNLWRDSNIRQWLNSSEQTIQWIQNPPPYYEEAGFLSNGNFTQAQRDVIKPITHNVLLSYRDGNLAEGGTHFYRSTPYMKIYGEGEFYSNWLMEELVQSSYEGAYHHTVTDKVFFLDIKEVYDYIYRNSSVLGDQYWVAKYSDAVLSGLGAGEDANVTDYWTRTPLSTEHYSQYNNEIVSSLVHTMSTPRHTLINQTTPIVYEYNLWFAWNETAGVRPALVLDTAKALKIKTGDGSLTSPYELDFESKSEVSVNVIDYKTGGPVENANVSLGNISQLTDTFGQTVFEVQEGEYTLSASKESYTEYNKALSVKGRQLTKTIYLQKGIAINAVNVTMPDGGVRNLLTDNGFTVDKLDENMYTIQADVNWNGNTGKIYLVGINSNIRKIFSGDTLQTQIGQEFPEDERFYIDVVADPPLSQLSLLQYSQSPYDEQRMLCIDVKDITEEAKRGLEQYKMPSVEAPLLTIELLNNMGLQLDMDQIGAVVGVEVKDRKVIIKFGAGETLPERQGALISPINNAGMLNKFTNLRMVQGMDVKLEVFGRMEIPIDTLINNGEYRGSVGFALSGERKSSIGNSKNPSTIAELQKQLLVGSIPVVVKLSVGAGFEAEVGLKGTRRDFSDASTTATITPKGSIRVSAGVGAVKVANVCVFGQGVLEGKINLAPEGNSFDPTVILSVGVELEVAKFQYEKVLLEDQFPKSGAKSSYLQEIDSADFKLMGREYLEEKTEPSITNPQEISLLSDPQNSSERLFQTVEYLPFSNAKSKPVILGSDTYMIYQVDDMARNPVNGLKLMFSKEELMTWYPPVDIYDDGTADGEFDVDSNGDTAFVVWENTKEPFDVNNVDFITFMSQSEITVSKFNNTTKVWDTPTRLTTDEIADFSPTLAVSGDKAVVVWLSNSESDIFGVNGINNINYAFYENGVWQSTNVIPDVGLVSSVSVAYDGNTAVLCYDKDMDGSLSTDTDRDVFIKNLSQNNSPVSISGGVNTNYSGEVFIQNGNFKVAYLNNDGINIVNDVFSPTTNLIARTNNFEGYGIEVVKNGNNAGILWLETGDDGFNQLCGTYYDTATNSWTLKSITKANLGFERDIKNLSATMKSDGSILLSYLQAPKPQWVVNGDGTTTIDKGYITLQAFAYTPGYNVEIIQDSIFYDEELYAKNLATPISFVLEVTGEKAFTDEINIMVYDGHPEYGGVLINTDSISGTFNPGDVISTQISYLPQIENGRKEIYIKVMPNYTEEFDSWDNIGSVSFGYGALSVKEVYIEKERDLYLLNSTIVNKGSMPANNILVSVYENNIDGNLIYSETIDKLASSEAKQIQLPISSGSIIFDNYAKSYYVEITLGNEDGSSFIDVGSMLGVIENPEFKPAFEVFITESETNINNEFKTSIIANNNTVNNKTAKLITAIYDNNNRFITMLAQDIVILAGMSISNQFSLNINYDLSGCTQKAFLLDSIGNIMPLANVYSKEVTLYK